VDDAGEPEPVVVVYGTDYLVIRSGGATSGPTSYVRGRSLPAVLQMLHLDRTTCLIEVVDGPRSGTLTLVNGDLVDADCDGVSGDEAALQILAWPRPQTTIFEGVTLFRHTVDMPLSRLIVESARRQDETLPQTRPLATLLAEVSAGAEWSGNWSRLTATLTVNGALIAAVIRSDDRVLSLADEYGRIPVESAQAALSELIPVVRAVRQWTRLVDPAVEELQLRAGDRHLLVHPLDTQRTHFTYVVTDAPEGITLARQTIRSFLSAPA
jgi:hypothetical protein